MAHKAIARLSLKRMIPCPHCWQSFPTEDIRWMSESPSLLGDARLGDDYQQRFLPSRFDLAGNAIDAGGSICTGLCCPNCHLSIPNGLLEISPLFISIVGAPSCGKTYFLASMIQQLRSVLPSRFFCSISDADPEANRIINDYVDQQFYNPDRSRIVRLAKTEEQGDLYSLVQFADRTVTLPNPFLFTIAPAETHPSLSRRRAVSRVMCLYDNAGESFLPGKDSAQNQVTRHLSQSDSLMFLFDPTQDIRFRKAIGASDDPQVRDEPLTTRQETILHELAVRVRKHAGLSETQRHQRPLIVMVTKYDAWSHLFGDYELTPPSRAGEGVSMHGLNLSEIDSVSQRLRNLLWQVSPELVTSAESFCEKVVYMPISATGRRPEVDQQTGTLGISPRRIRPAWCEVPILWTLAHRCPGLVPHLTPQSIQPDRSELDVNEMEGVE